MGVTLRRRSLAAVAILATAALGLVACSKSDDANTGSSSTEQITLNVDVFGNFGYEELYKKYMQDHPNIKIVERGTGGQLGDFTQQVTQRIAAGSGLGDVLAVEEGMSIDIKAKGNNFVDLKEYGAAELSGNFLDWKVAGMTTDDGKIIGLGTDVGGMAMCYRRDLFAKAGLPTDRAEVSALWKTWDDYIAIGERFKTANTGASFLDGAPNMFNTILLQAAGNGSGYHYYDLDNKLVVDSNPAVKQAWDTAMKIIAAGITGKFPQWSTEWVTAFQKGSFATIACPAWMTGVISGNAGKDASGQWDIASVPGNGGNWGGSFLAVPTQSKHPREAYELAKFLTSPQGQIGAFKDKGPLPSSPQALDDTAIKDATNAYFNNAPVGQIFGAGAKSLKPVYMGPRNQAVRTEVENAVRTVELGQRTPDQGWQEAVANAKKAAAK